MPGRRSCVFLVRCQGGIRRGRGAAGPEYHTEVLDVAALGSKPLNFLEISAYGADPTLLRISKTYCLASACIPPAHQPAANRQRQGLVYDVRIDDHVFADRKQCERVGTRTGWIRIRTVPIPPAERAWRVGRRDSQPEREPFAVEILHRRMDAQLHAAALPAASARRPSFFARCHRLAASMAKAQAKGKRITVASRALREAAKAEAEAPQAMAAASGSGVQESS